MKNLISITIIIFSLISCSSSTSNEKKATPILKTDTLSIASFNIEIFGQSKMGKPEAMAHIVDICNDYDIVGIQEIRSKEQNVIPTLIELLEQDGSNWDFVISTRLGRTSSKEQYAFVYRENIVTLVDTVQYVETGGDSLHREPFVATFRSSGNHDIVLGLIHTDPDEIDIEIPKLSRVFDELTYHMEMSYYFDFFLMGDFNASPDFMDDWFTTQSFGIAEGVFTNVADNKTYDNIIYNNNINILNSGVFNFKTEYNLSREEAEEVSDHYPVWFQIEVVNQILDD